MIEVQDTTNQPTPAPSTVERARPAHDAVQAEPLSPRAAHRITLDTLGDGARRDTYPGLFAAAVETTRMPMCVSDPNQADNPIIFVNKAFRDMTGYSDDELLGSNCRFLQGPDTDPDAVIEIRDALREEREVAMEILNYRKDGSSFWNALFISPVYGEDGELLYFFASQLDVSRRRDAEDALRQSQKMEALGQLTGGIAHDFNNIVNALEVVGKKIEDVTLATSGAGAAGIACLDMLVALGMKPQNIVAFDRDGVIYTGRPHLDPDKARYARDTPLRTLGEILAGADIFLGLSAGNILKPEMLAAMAPRPIILALANPTPEINPAEAKAARPDCIIATGRSDYPNQVNNALCFPYIFRGALDVGATVINEAMKTACVKSIAALARREASDLGAAYGDEIPSFGPEYLIPRPFDPRLLVELASAVAQAAMDSGVALRPISDMAVYRETLSQFVYRTSLMMKPVYDRARADRKRVAYAEGEEEVVLRAVQTVIDEGLAFPILIGRPDVIHARIERLGLRMREGVDYELTNQNDDPRFNEYWQYYHGLTSRRGVTPSAAKNLMRSRPTLIAAVMVARGEADALVSGVVGRFHKKLGYVRSVIPLEPGVQSTSAMTGVINDQGAWFFLDTHVQDDPTAEQIAEATLQASYRLKRFGIEPKVALLSHSNFGSHDTPGANKMRKVRELLKARLPKLEVDGEMQGDTAWDEALRTRMMPGTTLKGRANLFVMPNIDAANISYNLVRVMTDGVALGPILMGISKPVHILTSSATPRRIVNMTALAAVDAQIRAQQK